MMMKSPMMAMMLAGLVVLVLPLPAVLNGDQPMSEEPARAAALEPPAAESNPDEIRRGIRMGGEDGKSREQLRYERVIRQVEPDLRGDLDRLPVYTSLFMREMISDKNLFPTQVEATATEDGAIVLSGHVAYEQNKEALGKLFQYLGFADVRNDVELLPSEELGEEKFAFVTAPNTLVFDSDVEPRETMTEAMIGEPIFLLKEANEGYFLAQVGGDGYVGYIHGDVIRRVDAKAFDFWQSGPRAIFQQDFEAPDLGVFVPAGAVLRLKEDGGAETTVLLPDGKEVPVPAETVLARPTGPNPAALEAIERAAQKLGSDYKWGGKSSTGVDCSGLVQSAYKTLGIHLPRDTYMQAYTGRLAATRWYREGLQPGDLLFFVSSTGKINHTAIYTGDGQYIEASGEVQYTSFNPEDPNYDERRDQSFVFAKRVLE